VVAGVIVVVVEEEEGREGKVPREEGTKGVVHPAVR